MPLPPDPSSSAAKLLYGTDEPLEPVRTLRAGPLTLELRRGQLRHVRCEGREVWHGLAFVLRDPDWGTPPPLIESVGVAESDGAFDVSLRGCFASVPPVPFTLRIRGHADGEIRFDAEAVPAGDLAVNRLGMCLMHPLAVCGQAVEVTHVDGRTSRSTFPELIPPWPPFMLVRALRHEWAPGRWARATLEGDLFETEDQRNNADASFKTYSRSNMAPRPYTLHGDVPVRQSAVLRLDDDAPAVRRPQVRSNARAAADLARVPADDPPADDPPADHTPADEPLAVLAQGHAAAALPAIGIEIHARDAAAPPAAAAALAAALGEMRPRSLHLAWQPSHEVEWRGVASLCRAAGASLRVDALLPSGREAAAAALGTLRARLDAAGIEPAALAVFPSDPATVDAARAAFPRLRLGGGTPHFFVQLSRLETLGEVDFASFTTSSVVHGAEDDEVMLGLASLAGMVATWRARRPQVPLCVGPNTIAARASPLGAQPPSDGTRRLALAAIDPRTRAQFGAAWALGHVAACSEAGVQTITLLSLTGASGVVALDASAVAKTTAPGLARPHAAGRHPAFHLLAALAGFDERLPTLVSDRSRLAALALGRTGATRVLVANLEARSCTVAISGPTGSGRVQVLDALSGRTGWQAAPAVPARSTAGAPPGIAVDLAPYAIARVD